MNLILFSVTTFAVLDYFYRFMRFVSTDLAKIAKFLCFYSKSGLKSTWVCFRKRGLGYIVLPVVLSHVETGVLMSLEK